MTVGQLLAQDGELLDHVIVTNEQHLQRLLCE